MSNIRLNKILKELNISMSRAVNFLQEKGIEIEPRPTITIDEDTYKILVQEFQQDAERRARSEEISEQKRQEKEALKEELLKAEEERRKVKEVIRAKVEIKSPTLVGKIGLNPNKKQTLKKEINSTEEATEVKKPQLEKQLSQETPAKKEVLLSKKETSIVGKKIEIKSVGKIDLSRIKSNKPERKSKRKESKAKASKAEEKTEKKVEGRVEGKNIDKEKQVESEQLVKIETKYQKLDGLKITDRKIDLTQFKKPERSTNKPNPNKKKRARIKKEVNIEDEKKKANHTYRRNGQSKDRKGFQRVKRRKPFTTPHAELTDEQVQKQVKETLEKLTNKGNKAKGAKYRRDRRQRERDAREQMQQQENIESKKLEITEFVTVSELATMMDVSVTEIISTCMGLGIMATMNQRLDAETLTLVAFEFNFEVEFVDTEVEEAIQEVGDKEKDLVSRAPIVTVMGHVDHGKTSLLDYIREENVIAGESGGITQHIGAYSVALENEEKITFLDTPGHEAFTAMRARGTQVTDLAIIVIAADDSIMPQTKEAIAHAQAAGVPIIFAVNKIDKPGADPEKIKEQLASMNLLVEDWGGKIQSQDISAKKGTNVDELLEKVILESELLELKANPNKEANGTVIEALLDKGRGYVSTVLVQAGTLKVGDYMLAGSYHGKVRAMLDERGNKVKAAIPSQPVSILGLDGAPQAGDKFKVFKDEKEAKLIAARRKQLQREQSVRAQKHLTLGEIGRRIALGDFKELNIILKGDVDGSVEALSDSLEKLSIEEIHIKIVHKGVGQITESDVLLASASGAIVIGFNVRPGVQAKAIADREDIEIRTYSIIYDAINDVKEAMEGMLSPELKEEVTGNIEIRETFSISKVGNIAGCMVLDGKVFRNSKIRLIREGIVIHEGELDSLKRFKDDVKEVTKGYECGLNIKGFNDIKPKDIIEAYQEIEVKKKFS